MVGGGDGAITSDFSVSISNAGGLGGPSIVPVIMRIEGQEPEIVHEVSPFDEGTVAFNITRDLEPKQHSVMVRIGDDEQTIAVDARAPDIVVRPAGHTVTGDGSINLVVEVMNEGAVQADFVVISAALVWTSEGADEAGGIRRSRRTIASLLPGAVRRVLLHLDLPAGLYATTLNATTETPEALQHNNGMETSLGVEYVILEPNVRSIETVGYEQDGDGIVEIALDVTNGGIAPSGPISVGISCPKGPRDDCRQFVEVESISPDERRTVPLMASLPQGENPIFVFAGGLDDGYRWGDANVQQSVVTVPSKPAVSLAMGAAVEILGYRSDGTADSEITASLQNEGYRRVEDGQVITVVCHQGDQAIDHCGGELTVELSDGFGPAEDNVSLSAPMGSTLKVSLCDEAQSEVQKVQLEVPERILGIDRYVWECYSDRLDEASIEPGSPAEGCGGWVSELVYKWDIDRPVKLWRTGSAYYMAISLQVLTEVSSLLGIEFELVESEEEAEVKAYLGTPSSTAIKLGWPNCVDEGGCASWGHKDYRVIDGVIGVWHRELSGYTSEYISGAILHELLHVMASIGHRYTLDARMGRDGGLSPIEEEMLRLNSHRLVRPGMSMPEVRELIVLNEELLDPQPPSAYVMAAGLVEKAVSALREAGSVRFELEADWREGCGLRGFGPSTYELGEISGYAAGLAYFEGDAYSYWKIGEKTYIRSDGQWTESGTYWPERYWSPFSALTQVMSPEREETITVTEGADGRLLIERSGPLSRRIASISVSLDGATYQLMEYSLVVLGSPCSLHVNVTNSEYGIDIQIPDDVLQAMQRSER